MRMQSFTGFIAPLLVFPALSVPLASRQEAAEAISCQATHTLGGPNDFTIQVVNVADPNDDLCGTLSNNLSNAAGSDIKYSINGENFDGTSQGCSTQGSGNLVLLSITFSMNKQSPDTQLAAITQGFSTTFQDSQFGGSSPDLSICDTSVSQLPA